MLQLPVKSSNKHGSNMFQLCHQLQLTQTWDFTWNLQPADSSRHHSNSRTAGWFRDRTHESLPRVHRLATGPPTNGIRSGVRRDLGISESEFFWGRPPDIIIPYHPKLGEKYMMKTIENTWNHQPAYFWGDCPHHSAETTAERALRCRANFSHMDLVDRSTRAECLVKVQAPVAKGRRSLRQIEPGGQRPSFHRENQIPTCLFFFRRASVADIRSKTKKMLGHQV